MEFLSQSSFWTPEYLVDSAWHEHAPFAFWLIERHRPGTFVELGTHRGFSYCCFCQAIERLGLEAKAFAVDTWTGDDHAGFYGEEVFQRLCEYHKRYSAFSRLVRSSFDEALSHFPDASIDLLHIDGRHSYDDVKHDFTSWARKLSNRAIVLFHDTNVRERGFGVFRFWQEIRSSYRAFEFLHGHGLGVLAFGTDQKPELLTFFEAVADPQCALQVRAAYSQLGVAITREWQLTEAKRRIAALERSLLDAEQRESALNAERNAQLAEGQRRIAALEKKISEQDHQIDQCQRRLDRARSELADAHGRITALENKILEQDQQVDQYQRRLTDMRSSLSWRLTSPFRKLYGPIARLPTSPCGVKLAAALRHPTNSCKRKTYRARYTPQLPTSPPNVHARYSKLGVKIRALIRHPLSRQLRRQYRRQPAWAAPNTLKAVAVPIPGLSTLPVQPIRPGIIIHMFYPELAGEFRKYLNAMPCPADVYISAPNEAAKEIIKQSFEGWPNGSVTIRIVPNRGRDIAPKLVTFRDVYDAHELVLLIHTKRSSRNPRLAPWRDYLLQTLLGSKQIICSILNMFSLQPTLGMIAPEHFEPVQRWIGWGGNFQTASQIASRMGIRLIPHSVLEFPSGSMFWARSEAIRPLLALDLTFDSFPEESGQIDGTLAHAIERLFFYSCEAAGYDWLKIARPELCSLQSGISFVMELEQLKQFRAHHTCRLICSDSDVRERSASPFGAKNTELGSIRQLTTVAPRVPAGSRSRATDRRNPHVSNFSSFLVRSLIEPYLKAPFSEEDKRCFAVMENIAKDLSRTSKLSSIRPLVTVVMPVYNRAGLVGRAIRSVLSQSYPHFELLVVDDNSSDSSVEIVRSFTDPRVRLIESQANLGSAGARNLALDTAKGEIIAYLDSDNTWEPQFLEAMIGALIRLPEADAVYSAQIIYRGREDRPAAVRFGSFNPSLLVNQNYIDINCLVHRRELLERVGAFDGELRRFGDWDLALRFAEAGTMVSVPVLLSNYFSGLAHNTISANNDLFSDFEVVRTKAQKRRARAGARTRPLARSVSIVIPSYQALDDLKECISAIRTHYPSGSVLTTVVDNASGQDVRDYLRQLSGEHDDLCVIFNDTNYGFSYAVNQGIAAAPEGHDIVILNNDALLTAGAIEALQAVADSDPQIAITVPQQILPGGTKTINTHVPFAIPEYDCDVNLSAHHDNIAHVPVFHDGRQVELNFAPFFCAYIKRSVLTRTNGLDAEFGRHYRSDRIMCDFVRNVLGMRIVYTPEAIVYHKLQRSTETLRKHDSPTFDLMFAKNQWPDHMLLKLKYRKAAWDF